MFVAFDWKLEWFLGTKTTNCVLYTSRSNPKVTLQFIGTQVSQDDDFSRSKVCDTNAKIDRRSCFKNQVEIEGNAYNHRNLI